MRPGERGADDQPGATGYRITAALVAMILITACLSISYAEPVLAPPSALSLVGAGVLPVAGTPISLTPAIVSSSPESEIPAGTGIWSLTYWSRGLRCQGYLVVPSGQKTLPLLIVLHGGFPLGLPNHDSEVSSSAAEAAGTAHADGVVFLPNYAGYGPSQGQVGDTRDDLIDTLNGLKALRDIRGLRLAPDFTYLVGSSLGGAIALMLAERDRAVRAAVLVSPFPGAILAMRWMARSFPNMTEDDLAQYGQFNVSHGDSLDTAWYRLNSPDFARIHIPVLLIGGTHDPIVAPGMLRSLYAALRRHDRTVALRFFPGGHGPQSPGVDLAEVDFLARHGLYLH